MNFDEKTFDDLFHSQLGGSLETLEHLLNLFLTNTPDRLKTMAEGAANGDADTIQRMAHDVKSNSATLGATFMYELAKEIESMARQQKIGEDLFLKTEELKKTFEETKFLLEEKLASYSRT